MPAAFVRPGDVVPRADDKLPASALVADVWTVSVLSDSLGTVSFGAGGCSVGAESAEIVGSSASLPGVEPITIGMAVADQYRLAVKYDGADRTRIQSRLSALRRRHDRFKIGG